jgi:hypothetical protein
MRDGNSPLHHPRNLLQHPRQILHHPIIGESQDPDSISGKEGRPFGIILGSFRPIMNRSVDLDCDSFFAAIKIQHQPPDGMLAPEFPSAEFPPAERVPYYPLGGCWVFSKSSGVPNGCRIRAESFFHESPPLVVTILPPHPPRIPIQPEKTPASYASGDRSPTLPGRSPDRLPPYVGRRESTFSPSPSISWESLSRNGVTGGSEVTAASVSLFSFHEDPVKKLLDFRHPPGLPAHLPLQCLHGKNASS